MSMRILLVDNDPIYLNLLAEVLTLHSYSVVKANDGEVALEYARREPFDLVISDISMPRLNGINLHRRIRDDAQLKDTPFAWNTGYRELREAVEIADPTRDFRLDKTMLIPNLLYFLNHLEKARKSKDRGVSVASA